MNLLTLPSPRAHDTAIPWNGLSGSAQALAIAEFSATQNKPLLVITSTIHDALQLLAELRFFKAKSLDPIVPFPDWETLPYDHFSPHESIVSDRLSLLSRLPQMKRGIVIAALPTLMHRLAPKDSFSPLGFNLAINDTLDLAEMREQLISSGYRSVTQVMEHGEFAWRGSIIDLFPMGSDDPLRIELFDNQIESIRSFDPETQRSLEKIEAIRCLPAHEYPLTEDSIVQFRQAWRSRFSGNPADAPVYQQISQAQAASGAEYYLPLFYEHLNHFFDYLPKDTLVFLNESLEASARHFWEETQNRYEQLRYDTTHPLCEPHELFLSPDDFFNAIKPFLQIKTHTSIAANKDTGLSIPLIEPPTLNIDRKKKQPLEALQTFLKAFLEKPNARILFSSETEGRRETLLELFRQINLHPTLFKTWAEFLESQEGLGIVISPLEKSLILKEPALAIIAESSLFGQQVKQRRLRKKQAQDPNTMIRNLIELNIGAPVVHIDHGVGRYQGLKTIVTQDQEAEYLTLEFAGSDKIYVPITSLHLISRYTGADAEHAPLQKLGNKKWNAVKEKTAKRIRDVAAELLKLYSQRQATPGYAFQPPSDDFKAFRAGFPFEETPDQETAINSVINDMTSPHSMDRIVCGDVGFGKTEVAMQAAFLAVENGKQVALLVPTTLLAAQHTQNFQDRFANWPVKIACLSRLQSPKEQQAIIDAIANGKVDIIVGTHKLLSQEIRFKDLGLLIVDEEHRFGVRHKERIKALRAHVDILTLTATPIPRTLNMSLVGIRDLSIIATPPAKRLSIKTFVHEHNKALIREAILRETLRGGQAYFLHNDVATIEATAQQLREMAPEARVAIAHGQMRENQLEQIMSDFYHQKFNVLVCTTIVESGIDVPTANTIIINRADRFGLAQLHQLRGRVGRSHHQAYAYLLTPDKKSLTADAKRRLEAISELADLGVGFHLATHDLEIRGAGELLSEEQSGHIEAIGFSLYMELLEDAVKALKAGKEPNLEDLSRDTVDIDLGVTALFPKDYVGDVHTRLVLYKELADCQDEESIQSFKEGLIDRFGTLPEPAHQLLQLALLKIRAKAMGITQIKFGAQFAYLTFSAQPKIKTEQLIKLIQKQSQQYQLQQQNCLRIKQDKIPSEKRAPVIHQTLDLLS